MKSEIGTKLRTLRKGRGLTQLQLSERLDINRATLSNYEVGRRMPSLQELKRISEFYGVGLDYFGVVPTDEVFELLSRAKDVFNSPDVSKETKENLYKEFMKLYLAMK